MPNTTGGKNYKKSKHASGSFAPAFIERQSDQMYARIIRNLGNRNLLCFCNDNKIRLCHIRGSMRKKVWMNVGDLVLISIRDFEKKPEDTGKEYQKGDIVAKYDHEHLSKLKKMPDINAKLFMQLETADGKILAEIGKREDGFVPGNEEDYGILFDEEAKVEGESGSEDEEKSNNDDFDIDDI
jgi:translation initiation factor 1A